MTQLFFCSNFYRPQGRNMGSDGGDPPLEGDAPGRNMKPDRKWHHTPLLLVLTSSGGHCSGQYAPYWNAFLFKNMCVLLRIIVLFVYACRIWWVLRFRVIWCFLWPKWGYINGNRQLWTHGRRSLHKVTYISFLLLFFTFTFTFYFYSMNAFVQRVLNQPTTISTLLKHFNKFWTKIMKNS